MPNVLVLDLSANETAELCLSSVEGGQWKALESSQVAFNNTALKELGQIHDSESPEQAAEASERIGTARSALDDCLKQLLGGLKHSWTSSAVILPSHNVISLNIELPVFNKRSIHKVLQLELEDRLPFSLDGFHIQSSVTGRLTSGLYDIHVDLLPRKELTVLLEVAKTFGLDPTVVTTPPAVLAILDKLLLDHDHDCAWVLVQDNFTHLCLQHQGSPRMIRTIHHEQDLPEQRLLTQYQASLRAFRERYSSSISKAYLSPTSTPSPLDQHRSVEKIPADQLPRNGNLAALCSLFFQTRGTPDLITNFRSADLAYRPQIDEIVRGLKQLKKPFLIAASVAFLSLMLVYWLEGYRTDRLQNAINARVQEVLPKAPTRGQEIQQLQAELGKLHQQLRDIGSASKVSPVNALLELMGDFHPVPEGVELKKLSVTGSRLSLEGHAPDYSTIDSVTEKLRAKSSLYCEVPEPKANAIRRNRYSFELNIGLCEG